MATATSTATKRDCCEDARQAIEQRRALLGPCLAAMGFSEHGAPPPELPDPLLFGGFAVPLEPWERSVLLGDSGGDSAVLLSHFAEGIAFRALAASRLHHLEAQPPSPSELDGTRAMMVEETAVGIALQREVQRDIHRLVSKGAMGDAKKLTVFRRKIDQALAQLEQKIGAQAKEQAQARSVELLTPRDAGRAEPKRTPPPVEKGLTLEDLYALEEKLDKELAEKPPEPTAEELFETSLKEQEAGAVAKTTGNAASSPGVDPARRSRLLVMLLAVCVVAYSVFLFSTREDAPPPRLELEHFQHLEAVQQVKPRPPSLFVLVHTSQWTALPESEQTALVEELGRIAGKSGYQGVQVRTTDGKNVGQWLRKTGAQLNAAPDAAS